MTQRSFFKVYGCFSAVVDGTAQENAVAGYFHFYSKEPVSDSNPNADHPIYVVWIPHQADGNHHAPEPYELSEIDPNTEAGKKKLDELYRLDKPFRLSMRKVGDVALIFRGAAILEQIRRTKDGPQLNLQWILASKSNYGDGHIYSEVKIGQKSLFDRAEGDEKEATFGFQLCLPTPGAQGVVNNKPVEVFPFQARYSANYSKPSDNGLSVAELAAGAEGTSSECDWIDTRKFSTDEFMDSMILGRFGFSRKDGHKKYVHFPRGTESRKKEKSDSLWLRDSRKFSRNKLGKFANLPEGYDESNDFGHQITLSSELQSKRYDEAYDSIWPQFEGGETRIYFRSAFRASGEVAQGLARGDIRITSSEARLRSPFDQDAAPNKMALLDRAGGQGNWTKFDLITTYELDQPAVQQAAYSGNDGPSILAIGEVEVRFLHHWRKSRVSASGSLMRSTDYDLGTIANTLVQGLRSQRLPRLALDSVEAQDSTNGYPDAKLTATQNKRFAVGGEVPFVLERDEKGISSFSWKVKNRNREKWAKIDVGLSVWEVNSDRGLAEESSAVFLDFALPGVDQGGGSIFRAQLYPAEKLGRSGEGGVRFLLKSSSESNGDDKKFSGRLNGLDFHAERPTIGAGDAGHWHFNRGIIEEKIESEGRANLFLAYDNDFEITIGVASIKPVGTNSGRGDRDRSSRPILLGVGEKTKQSAVNFEVTLREEVSRSKDRLFTAEVRDKKAAGADTQHYVVISEEPFALAAFAMAPLEKRSGADDNLVAQYSSEQREWSFRSAANRFHYRLPPQGVGESMDKPRQLEIWDQQKTESPEPYVRGKISKTSALSRRVVDYRLTSPAQIWIEPSDLKRNYVTPEWEMHDLFRQSGDFGFGSKLSGLRAEFIYGLVASVNPSEESGQARATRIVEIEMLLGRPPSPERDPNKTDDRTRNWNGIRKAIAHRPERLELWMPDAEGQSYSQRARFSDSARFSLREKAQFRSPFPANDSQEPEITPDPEKALGERLTRHGLAGGPVWGLEARAFVKEFLKNPDSTGGSIERIALAPHGGDADFRAEFLNGLLAVIAEVRGGRVQRQRVEVIGRVGVFWHRAKHVVIYERTVNLSPQFTPEGGIEKRSRRPIIRKVEEFVELLESERNFPDTEIGLSNGPGFLKSVCFNSKRIHVDSAWSEDVGESGWKIPLWNQLSAKQRPSVYPHPDIAFISHSEGEEASPVVAQQCLDPDNLYFYSDSKAEDARTDLWDPVLTVDWVNLPAPKAAQQKDLDGSGARAHPRRPSAQRIPRGQRKFTWRLGPAGRRVQINFGRAGSPIYTALETLTFSRATANKVSAFSALVNDAMREAGSLDETDPLQQVRPQLAEFLRQMKLRKEGKPKDAAKALRKAIETAKFPSPFESDQTKQFLELAKKAQEAPDQCAKMVDDFSGSVERKRLLIMANLREWQEDAKTDLAISQDEKREEWIGRAVIAIREAVNPTFQGVSADIGNAQVDVERARAMAIEFVEEARGLILRSLDDLQAAHAAYDDGKPWSPARIADYQQQLENARAGVVADVETELNETRLRLATEIGGVATLVGSAAANALESAAMGPRGLITKIGHAETAAQAVLREQLDQFTGEVAKVQAIIKEAIDAVKSTDLNGEEILTNLYAVQARLDFAVKEMNTKAEYMERQILASRHNLAAVIANAEKLLSEFKKNLDTALDEAAQELQSASEAALDRNVKKLIEASKEPTEKLSVDLGERLKALGKWAANGENYLLRLKRLLEASLDTLDKDLEDVSEAIACAAATINDSMETLKGHVAPAKVTGYIEVGIVRPLFDLIITEETFDDMKADADNIAKTVDQIIDDIGVKLENFATEAADQTETLGKEARKVCDDLKSGVQAIGTKIKEEATKLDKKLKGTFTDRFSDTEIDAALDDARKLKELLDGVDNDFNTIEAGVQKSKVEWDSYADRVFHEVGRLGSSDLASAPNRILQLYAAAASAPELPNLDYARKRLGYYYDGINSVIDTTPAEAYFAKLGSELKSLGLALPFDKLDNRLLPSDLSGLDIGKVLRKFSGIDLSGMFRGTKMPKGAKDVIRLTHEFDEKQFRAWVQIDIDLPMKGRKTLFGVGPFKMDFVDSHLHATVRLEASKDTEKVRETGHASLVTTVDSVVSGQSMVQLKKLALNFDQKGKLDVQLDPKNIQLNPAFKFIQEALSTIFPDDVGGMKLVKQNGLPIGVEHEFAIPPISIMGGTSGISNLAISNRFSLLAFPDFVIANSFALCRPEAPFLFTIFVIGGAGYITIDAEYRPFNGDLAITVEAAAGGSAAFGFSLGPINGMVFISLSIALSYRKLIGRSGGGLSMSVVLVIAGKVDVAGLATVYLTLSLRMNYRNNGQIDGLGSISIKISVTRFWDYKYRKNVNKVLQKGKSSKGQRKLSHQKAVPNLAANTKAKAIMNARASL